MSETQTGGNKKRATPGNAQLAARQRAALELRITGATFDQIADQLGMANRSVAWKAVTRGLTETQRPAAEELRTLLTLRYEALLLAAWPLASAGDVPAINAARRIVDSLVKLHIPIRIEGTITQQSETDAALHDLVAELDRRAITATKTVVATNGESTS